MTKKKEGSFGFHRGFLLAKKKGTKTRRPRTTSSALLNLETAPDPLFALGDNLRQSDDSGDSGDPPFSRQRHSHTTVNQDDTTLSQSRNESTTNSLMFGNEGLSIENSKDRREGIVIEETKPSWIIDDASDASTGAPLEESPAIDTTDRHSSSVSQKDISRLLFRLKRRSDFTWWRKGCLFVSNLQSDEDWSVAWKSVLDALSVDPSSLAPLRLGACLVQSRLDHILPLLRYSPDKEERSRLLACLYVLLFYLSTTPDIGRDLGLMVERMLPRLSGLVSSAAGKRTVLTQRAFQVAIMIIQKASSQAVTLAGKENDRSLTLAVFSQREEFGSLLDSRLAWSDQSSGNCFTQPCSNSSRGHRRQALLLDWKQWLSAGFRGNSDQPTVHAVEEMAVEFCRQLKDRADAMSDLGY